MTRNPPVNIDGPDGWSSTKVSDSRSSRTVRLFRSPLISPALGKGNWGSLDNVDLIKTKVTKMTPTLALRVEIGQSYRYWKRACSIVFEEEQYPG